MLVIFIAASTGLNFYIHICSCSQTTFASVFEEHKCHEEAATSCCDLTHEQQSGISESDCGCKSLKFQVSIDEVFNSTEYITANTKLFSFHLAKLAQPLLVLNNISQVTDTQNYLYIPDDSPPIKPVGRILVYLLHQSKTPDLVS